MIKKQTTCILGIVFVQFIILVTMKSAKTLSENTRLWLVFSAFRSCSQMPVMFYDSVLGVFIC